MTDTAAAPQLRDYVAWHEAYDDPRSDLSRRLRIVQRAISTYLDQNRRGVRVLSVCAGQGHDILGVLNERTGDRQRVTGTLVEINPRNVAVARRRIKAQNLRFTVIEGDAGKSDTYRGLPKANLVLLAGIMGNISADDIQRLIKTARQFCAPDAQVIWTRGNQEPDLGPQIREWFHEAGFAEVSIQENIDGTSMRVGVEQLVGDPEPLETGVQIFSFIR